MSIAIACPTCGAKLTAPDVTAGKVVKCPKCSASMTVPGTDFAPGSSRQQPPPLPPARVHPSRPYRPPPPVLEVEPVPYDDEPAPVSKGPSSDFNFVRRYMRWCGLRSFIFQVLLFAWTALMVLVWLGMSMSAVAKQPDHDPYLTRRQSEDAQAAALGMLSCCTCGGYLLFAIPLGIGAIATLEIGKSNRP